MDSESAHIMLYLMAHCGSWLGLTPSSEKTTNFDGCPAEFDGVVCWSQTPRGYISSVVCPFNLPLNGTVERECDENATWENDLFVNYSSCGVSDNHVWLMKNEMRKLSSPAIPGAPAPNLIANVVRRLQDCHRRARITPVPADGGKYCNMTFDGYSCWDYTPAGSTAYVTCPSFVEGFDATRTAFKACMENGSWFRHPGSGKEWSNYTTCVDVDDLHFRMMVNTVYITGYSISFVALLLSLIIFFSFRSLKCTRIAIHVQLFLSFAANNLGWIVWYKKVVGDPNVVSENDLSCQALHICLQYLMLANYMWMFCEGLHLHLALVVVFVKDEVVMRWFLAVGWALPFPITAIYAVVRLTRPADILHCWMNDSVAQWVLTVPVCLSLLASGVFLVNVVRVLLTKLHSHSANPAPVGLRKAVRAAAILVPLFGLQHVLLPFRPAPNAPGERVYQMCSAILVSLQGLCVSCLFCFANVDVHGAIRPLLRRVLGGAPGGSAANTHTLSRDVCV